MIAAGFGCRTRCTAEDLLRALERALASSGRVVGDVAGLYSAELEGRARALAEAASRLDKPLRLLPRAALLAEAGGALTRSTRVGGLYGLPSIAETAALAGARELGAAAGELGPAPRGLAPAAGAVRLLAPRTSGGAATCALARWEGAP